MLFSKRADLFLPNLWPTYFSKALGCEIYDLDGCKYQDFSLMGVGTNTLGYSNPEVDEAVKLTIAAGNMSTFNCPEEVYLAEKLIEMHPWFDMARFTRSGGEANAVAIRIARAASGREQVAICGYHGWHDWYLAANLLNDSSLKTHLLDGLDTTGVPTGLSGSVLTFNYNDFESLQKIVDEHSIGVIKMEVSRNFEPAGSFLQKVRSLADKHNIVLVFDECTSGFRETWGGLHKKYNVEPDMAVFGKALGNGYAINAVLGKREIMECAQSTFISSTFWTERIGPTAALKTLEVMNREKSWEKITAVGKKIRDVWFRVAQDHRLDIEVNGLFALSTFTFQSPHHQIYKTFITQEMLKKGFLANTTFYASTCHSDELIEQYEAALNDVFACISECERGVVDLSGLLQSSVSQSGFKRLN